MTHGDVTQSIRLSTSPCQADSPKETGKPSGLVLHVKPSRLLIGTIHYAPQVTIANNSEATVLVTEIELATRQKIYSDSSVRPQDVPREISAKQSQDFTVLFRLDDPVHKTFKEPAELRVHYRSVSSGDIARITVVQGALDDAR